ncbi:hypothetical protein C8R46DRAFT_1100193 [Mycena filopes]|nr:hypothetical protein C8R46DRAFT_1100193 [Mycena filopes]
MQGLLRIADVITSPVTAVVLLVCRASSRTPLQAELNAPPIFRFTLRTCSCKSLDTTPQSDSSTMCETEWAHDRMRGKLSLGRVGLLISASYRDSDSDTVVLSMYL